jgi:preprotein translocase subunit SecG
MLRFILIAIQVLSSFAIIGLVLIQRGKGAEAGAGFGAGASGTVFGAKGASTALSKATAVFAAIFMINSLALAYTGTRASEAPKSILEEASGPPPKPAAGAAPPLTPPPTGSAPGSAAGSAPAAAPDAAHTAAQKSAPPPAAPAPAQTPK